MDYSAERAFWGPARSRTRSGHSLFLRCSSAAPAVARGMRMASEIKDPRTTIPFAVVGGIAIAAIVYLIVAGTTLGVLGADAMGHTDAPILRSAVTAIAAWSGWMILMSSTMTAFSEMLGDLLSTSKVGHAMGKARE